jgi:tetratricopeptide (TPR) repeat protein
MKGKALWLLGYPDQALENARTAVTLSIQLQHPFTLRQALHQQAKIHLYRGEASAALACVEKVNEHYTDHPQFPYAIDHVVAWTWALAQLGRAGVDTALVHKACLQHESEGSKFELPFYLAILAEIYEQRGEIERALDAIRHAQAIAAMTQEDHYLSEIHRLAGKYLLAAGDMDAAQSNFLLALEIAQTQGAKSLELRAALSLSQLWAEQGERTRAYALLAGVYNWFSEGFDTADLRAAQTLLQTLAPSQTVSST